MGFQKGHKKVGGRKKSVPNKDTKALRDAIKKYCLDEIPDILKAIKGLNDPQKIDKFLQLLEYGIGKINRVDVSGGDEGLDGVDISDGELISRINGFIKLIEKRDKRT